ncbi:MAG: hypothetical protein FD145_568 [Candidatus Saganbacteria bacterium]|uniref:Nucleotidyltransferase family protein n=1 Tax=Candidatus Saganbacteria bacterium TaxID=2575572 RepID=A0A833L1J1_UNCSA|nr:MAG: hypothetical protein FD145_568 [Candidatus Saganbacteria bacterium]
MNFEKLLSGIEKIFKKSKIPYMLVGGFAIAYWGYPRQSLDIDIVVDLNLKNILTFLSLAKQLGFKFDQQEIQMILPIGNRFVMELGDFRADIWLPKTQFEINALKNRNRKKVFGYNFSIISAENLILSKLLAGRPRDFEDAKTVILRRKNKLNRDNLMHQALALNIGDLLDKLFAE